MAEEETKKKNYWLAAALNPTFWNVLCSFLVVCKVVDFVHMLRQAVRQMFSLYEWPAWAHIILESAMIRLSVAVVKGHY